MKTFLKNPKILGKEGDLNENIDSEATFHLIIEACFDLVYFSLNREEKVICKSNICLIFLVWCHPVAVSLHTTSKQKMPGEALFKGLDGSVQCSTPIQIKRGREFHY